MQRSVCALVLLMPVCTVLAAPAPEPFKSGWDAPVDPDRDCKFVRKGWSLTIETPGSDHEFAPLRGRFNAPRLLRDVEGDFLVQVRVVGLFRPSTQSSVEGEEPSVAAGLMLITTNETCIRHEYAAFYRKGEQRTCPVFRMRGEQDFSLLARNWRVPKEPDSSAANEEHLYLRLERRGHDIHTAISTDSKEWTRNFTVGIPGLPAKLKMGVAAYSTSTEPFKARFDQFKLIRGRKKS